MIAALGYARGGRRVFPARDKDSPRVSWRKAATTDERTIVTWWSRWPRDLVCVPTDEVDVVLDVEPPAGLATSRPLPPPIPMSAAARALISNTVAAAVSDTATATTDTEERAPVTAPTKNRLLGSGMIAATVNASAPIPVLASPPRRQPKRRST